MANAREELNERRAANIANREAKRAKAAAAVKREGGIPIQEVFKRYVAGEEMCVLEKESGLTRRQLHYHMLAAVGDKQKYRDVVTAVLAGRVADADHALANATTLTEVARATQMRRWASQDLERKRPELYGMKQEVKHTGAQPTINFFLLDKPSPGAITEREVKELPPPEEKNG